MTGRLSWNYRENSKLFKYFEREDESNRFVNLFHDVYGLAENILPRFDALFPSFTPHGMEHVKEVLRNLDAIIPENVIETMTVKHLFTLLSASVLHDIGMVATETSTVEEIVSSLQSRDALTNDETERFMISSTQLDDIRTSHHLRSYEWIIGSQQLAGLGFQNIARNDLRYLREMIGLVAKGHRHFPNAETEFGRISRESGVHSLRFLAAALQLADELDFTKDRIYWMLNRREVLDLLEGPTRRAHLQHTLIEDYSVSSRGEILTIHTDTSGLQTQEASTLLQAVVEKVRDTLERTSTVPWGGDNFPLPSLLRLDPEVLPTIPIGVLQTSFSLPLTPPKIATNIGDEIFRKIVEFRERKPAYKTRDGPRIDPREFQTLIGDILKLTEGLEIEEKFRTSSGARFDFLAKITDNELDWLGESFPVQAFHPMFSPRPMDVVWFLHKAMNMNQKLAVFFSLLSAGDLVRDIASKSVRDYRVKLVLLDHDTLASLESGKGFLEIIWGKLRES